MDHADAFEYAIRKDVRNNPIVREVDQRRQRELWASLGIGAALVLVVMFSAWQHFELIRHGYNLEQHAARARRRGGRAATPASRDRDAPGAPAHREARDGPAGHGGAHRRRRNCARAGDDGGTAGPFGRGVSLKSTARGCADHSLAGHNRPARRRGGRVPGGVVRGDRGAAPAPPSRSARRPRGARRTSAVPHGCRPRQARRHPRSSRAPARL